MKRVPKNFPVRPLTPKAVKKLQEKGKAHNLATCGNCGRTWDDSKPTQWTPAPSGRCPFEYYH